MTEPNTLDEQIQKPFLDRILLIDTEKNIMGGESDRNAFVLLGTPQELMDELSALFTEHSKEVDRLARIDEIKSWFDLPKHYPGEEYRDEPFAKVKCKTPDRVQYYTLDSRFTYALLTRLTQLKRNKGEDNETN